MSDVFGSLAAIRAELAALMAQIDTGELPAPDRIRHGGRTGNPMEQEPGATWEPAHKVKIFTVDTPDGSGAVFVTDVRYGLVDKAEWEAFKVDEARRLGMALLAAADWADQHRADVPRLDVARVRRLSNSVAAE